MEVWQFAGTYTSTRIRISFLTILFGKRNKTNVVLKFIHPAVFFLARICVALPVSYNFMKDLFLLIASGNAHSEGEDRVCCLLYPTVALSP